MPSPGLLPAQYPTLETVASLMNVPQLECDQRALQLAYELTRLHLQGQNLQGQNGGASASEMMMPGLAGYGMYGPPFTSLQQRFPSQPPSPTSAAAAALAVKRSQNMTECVQVPSSEHVAEIVGKQGCKIKALRSKTATYIKTPVRGEEAIFVITGRREDVEIAKNEILQAAEHFTQIRAQRRLHPPPHIPGQVTIQLPVPLRLVGLIVGPKGQTIKKVQQDTVTYIITPGRDKDPVFEITGCHEGVERARELIEDHVLARTGSTLEELLIQQNDPTRQRSSSMDNGSFGMDIWKDTERLFGSASPDNLSGGSGGKNDSYNFDIGCWNVARESDTPDMNGGAGQFFSPNKQQRSFSIANPGSQEYYNDYGSSSSGHGDHHRRVNRLNSDPIPTGFNGNGPSIWTGGNGNGNSGSCGDVFQTGNTGNSSGGMGYFSTDYGAFGMFNGKASLNSTGDSACSSSPAESIASQKKQCYMCADADVIAAFVPCGHNLFCLTCARSQQRCPICHVEVEQVIRIQGDL
ncbi:RNA-binding protein MEX3B [Hypsibius exemplaris]|uniref:RNA-binding protein MEX3B n=1 Tax=Hypsibius exemplaris TaxID=2072580 RepID=A0A1W0WEY6_HYPEX|nr:RNA-binding protein MEX3B [Hypsibius exemplaris]